MPPATIAAGPYLTFDVELSVLTDGGGREGWIELVATPPDEAPDLSKLTLIDYDFAKYGSSAERKRLLKRWDDEVGALPR